MRIAFAGTPDFARTALERLIAARFEVAMVLTQPDRPAGRGMKLTPSPVKSLALEHNLNVAQPRGLRLDGKYADDAAAAQAALRAAAPEVLIVAAYGLILPRWALELPPRGCLNIHASLLPRWRGAAPIHRAIEAGDTRTGITIMQMDEGLDTGDMLLVEPMPIAPGDTTGTLHDRLAALGGRLAVEALEMLACGGLTRTPQPAAGITYAHKIDKREAEVDWHAGAAAIERRLRAFDPFPGASTGTPSGPVKLWRGHVGAGRGRPGEVLAVSDAGVEVACGDGSLVLTELQRPGGKRLDARSFLQGHPIAVGTLFAPTGR